MKEKIICEIKLLTFNKLISL